MQEELQELHNEELAETIRVQKKRVIDAWTSNWVIILNSISL